MNGTLASINLSNGGVPKRPSDSCEVRVDGIVGDGHRHREHGGPDRAVVLFSQELIDALRGEGHPIEAGSTGENLTLRGVDWNAMVPGARVEIGEVVLELTKYTSP